MEMRGITILLSYDSWGGLGVTAGSFTMVNPAGVGLSNTNRGIVWLRNNLFSPPGSPPSSITL